MNKLFIVPVFIFSAFVNVTSARADWKNVGAFQLVNPIRCGYRIMENRPVVSDMLGARIFHGTEYNISRLSGKQSSSTTLMFPVPENYKPQLGSILMNEDVARFLSFLQGQDPTECVISVRVSDKGLKPTEKSVRKEYEATCYQSDMALPLRVDEKKILLQTDCEN